MNMQDDCIELIGDSSYSFIIARELVGRLRRSEFPFLGDVNVDGIPSLDNLNPIDRFAINCYQCLPTATNASTASISYKH